MQFGEEIHRQIQILQKLFRAYWIKSENGKDNINKAISKL